MKNQPAAKMRRRQKFGDLVFQGGAPGKSENLHGLKRHAVRPNRRPWVSNGGTVTMPLAPRATNTARLAARCYFFRRTTRIRVVAETAPGVRASSTMAACSCWCRLPDPVAGLALSGRPT